MNMTTGDNTAIDNTPRVLPGTGMHPAKGSEGFQSRWARMLLWCRAALRGQVQTEGLHHVPQQGGALLVANRVSPDDAWMLASVLPRKVLFVSEEDPTTSLFLPKSSRSPQQLTLPRHASSRERGEMLQAASAAIRGGQLVCLFAEGQISQTGQMLPFGTDSEAMLKGLETPIIPVGLTAARHRVWRKAAWAHFGAPLASTTTVVQLRTAVQELVCEAWRQRAKECAPLHRAFRRTARRHPFRFAMSDARVPRLGFLAALAGAIHLARKLRGHWADEDKVGILLPPSVAGALVNLAALLAGKVTVNLNYTCSTQTIAACISQCGIRTVVTSELFLQKAKVQLPCPTLALEKVVGRPRLRERVVALAMGLLLPASWLERALGRGRSASPDEIATIIFSSGSTGEPKGVMLTHANVAANIAQLAQVYRPTSQDRMLGVLPFFHSFGYTATLCLPVLCGMGVAYHPTPLDATAVGRLVRDHCLTFLLGTPTFLQLYLNTCASADFGSLRVVLAAAEKLPDRLAAAFEDKFGIRPLEGYGCTECSPAVAVNTHDVRAPGLRQVGAKKGSIGHPLPGVAVRIVDPMTEEPVPFGQPGLLLVRGPNVMAGYLDRPDLTERVFRQGWYVTGDIAAMDDDGFLRITDRLSRFSKIGGEMVPHLRVEERLHELAGATQLTFVVTSVPDERKGERLVVLHTLPDPSLQPCLDRLAKEDLPNLWKPKPDAFFRVEGFPLLGSGKLDLRRIKELARTLSV